MKIGGEESASADFVTSGLVCRQHGLLDGWMAD